MVKNTKQKTKNIELPVAEMTVSELVAKSRELGEKINKTKLLIRSGKSRNTREVFNLRKELARVLVVKSAKI